MTSRSLAFRPYARLLTMLGDQLIRNERIALVELIKNSYDADASKVEVRFDDFGKSMTVRSSSRIVVRDDGFGMTYETVLRRWMSPAAPQKYLNKRDGGGTTPVRGRIIQGEKGIGRFSVLKLGRKIRIVTRPRDSAEETTLVWDFSGFDEDFTAIGDQQREIFLDEIGVDCYQSAPDRFPGSEHGCEIEIRDLRGGWTEDILEMLCRDFANLTDPVSRITRSSNETDRFDVSVLYNGVRRSIENEHTEQLKSLIEDKSVLDIYGKFDCNKAQFFFNAQAGSDSIDMMDSKIRGLWVWRQRFGRVTTDRNGASQKYTCGDFSFHFYIFDFARGIHGRHSLIQKEKNLLKSHRIYLYRDSVRVYPYGDPDDDWLNIDVTRGTGRAGDFFSNDQIVGWIDITQSGNPLLRDKTNREGLIETRGAASDLIFLVQVFLSYVKQYPYARYQQKQRQRDITRVVQHGAVAQSLAKLKEAFRSSGHQSAVRDVSRVESEYDREKRHLSQRAEMTEDLAGVGLSVEMASHDIMLLMSRAQEISGRIAWAARMNGSDAIREHTDMLIGVLQQITDGMQDLQVLFKSSRRRRKVLRVVPVLDKIHRIYGNVLQQRGIRYHKITETASPLTANTTDGVVMQVLINLFDNACYWLETVDRSEREIRVTVDGEHGELIFSDSGPGIDSGDMPYIFEPFYSGKGQKGRGLGLYIARQLLERHDYCITVSEEHQRILRGANFVVRFVKEDA